MKGIAISILILITLNSIGQERSFNVKMYPDGDTTLWYKLKSELVEQIELENLYDTNNKWHFRIWTDEQVFEIWKDSLNRYNGRITSWTKDYPPNKKRSESSVYYEYAALDSNQINSLLGLLDSMGIKEMPVQDSIIGWSTGCDGSIYTIETSNKTDYYFKTYWTPSAQDSIKEALSLIEFIDSVEIITYADSIWNSFKTRIPFACYNNDTILILCTGLTKRELKARRKEWDRKIKTNANK